MLIGHYAPALIAKTLKPQLPLWHLFIAVQLVDIAWVIFCMVQLETFSLDTGLATNPLVLEHQPFSHSLLATLIWSLAGLALAVLMYGRKLAEAALLAALVASHWLLDFLVHRPDLLVWGQWKVGLALWDLTYLALALELSLFGACAWWSCRAGALPRASRWLLLALASLLVFNYLVYPPAQPAMILASALAVYLLAPLAAWWLERERRADAEAALG